jgi:hypothetical protein
MFQRPYRIFETFHATDVPAYFFLTRCVRLGYVWLQDVLMWPVTLVLICTKKDSLSKKRINIQYLILLT